jgi:hypothetical protein
MQEIYKKCYKRYKINFTTRSQLLYVALKNNGFKPRMWRYLNSKNQEKRVKIKLVSGEKFESHVVILLDDNILDSNLPQKMLKEEYEKRIKEINKKIMVISTEYWTNPSKDDLKRICDQCNLSYFFTEALKNPENFKPNVFTNNQILN